MIRVELGSPTHPQATALLQASHALMQKLFPAESNHFLSIDDLCVPEVSFFHAVLDGNVVGVCALKQNDGYGEVKSMFTAPEARGGGAGAKLLQAVEARARALGMTPILLETGNSLHSAHRLYERHGFTYRGPFGDYMDDPMSLFMEKAL